MIEKIQNRIAELKECAKNQSCTTERNAIYYAIRELEKLLK